MADVWQGYASPTATPSNDVWSGIASPVSQPDTSIGNQLGLTARYGVEGAMALPNMIGNAANTAVNLASTGINKVAGTNIPMLGMPSQTTSDLLTQADLPQPQGPQQRMVGDMSRAVAGLGTGMGFGNAVADVAPEISSAVTQAPAMQARAAVGSAGAAGGTRELGGGPIAQTMAGLGGGYLATRTPFTPEQQEQPISQLLKSDARDAFADADTSGANFNQASSQQLPNDIESAMAKTGKMNARLHGDTISVLDDLKNDAQDGNLSLEDLHQYRQNFQEVINNNLHPNGGMKPDAMKANQAIDAIDNMIDNAKNNPSAYIKNGSPEALDSFQNGLSLWAKSARANDIERIMDRADMMEQPATALRTGFRTLASNPKRMNMFDDESQDLIRSAADVSMPVEILRGLGSRLISAVAAGTGHIGGAVVAQAGGAIPRNLATQMQMNRAQAVLDNIARPNSLMQPMADYSGQLGASQGMLPVYQYGGQQ